MKLKTCGRACYLSRLSLSGIGTPLTPLVHFNSHLHSKTLEVGVVSSAWSPLVIQAILGHIKYDPDFRVVRTLGWSGLLGKLRTFCCLQCFHRFECVPVLSRCELWTRRTATLLIGTSFLTLSIGMSIYALYQNQQAESEVSSSL